MTDTKNTGEKKGDNESTVVEQVLAQNALLIEQNKKLQEGFDKQGEEIKELQQRPQSSEPQEELDVDDLERTAPESCYLRCFEDSPIVKTTLIEKEETDQHGNVKVTNVVCEFETLSGKKGKLPYGSTGKNDYLNLPRNKFKFADSIDETGASRVENEVIEDLGNIQKQDPSNIVSRDGNTTTSGITVKQRARNKVRYYTIVVDGEKHELHEKVLSK